MIYGGGCPTIESFQSTPSVGRATLDRHKQMPRRRISIHALRGEGDSDRSIRWANSFYFNPRPPWGGRPDSSHLQTSFRNFNPRPPWGGRRLKDLPSRQAVRDFNPRPPWGGRPLLAASASHLARESFQSTPSVGRATAKIYKYAMLCLYIVHIKLYIFATAVLFT